MLLYIMQIVNITAAWISYRNSCMWFKRNRILVFFVVQIQGTHSLTKNRLPLSRFVHVYSYFFFFWSYATRSFKRIFGLVKRTQRFHLSPLSSLFAIHCEESDEFKSIHFSGFMAMKLGTHKIKCNNDKINGAYTWEWFLSFIWWRIFFFFIKTQLIVIWIIVIGRCDC